MEIEAILEKLRERDSVLFNQIIDVIHNQDYDTSRILAHEVAEIRKAIVIIENASADILFHPNTLTCYFAQFVVRLRYQFLKAIHPQNATALTAAKIGLLEWAILDQNGLKMYGVWHRHGSTHSIQKCISTG